MWVYAYLCLPNGSSLKEVRLQEPHRSNRIAPIQAYSLRYVNHKFRKSTSRKWRGILARRPSCSSLVTVSEHSCISPSRRPTVIPAIACPRENGERPLHNHRHSRERGNPEGLAARQSRGGVDCASSYEFTDLHTHSVLQNEVEPSYAKVSESGNPGGLAARQSRNWRHEKCCYPTYAIALKFPVPLHIHTTSCYNTLACEHSYPSI